MSKNIIIDGFEEACHRAKKEMDRLKKFCRDDEMKKYSLPQCDFKLYEQVKIKDLKRRCRRHLVRAGMRARVMNRINRRDDKLAMKGLLTDYKNQ